MVHKIKIAIAEDHALLRDGYISLLSKEHNIQVVGAVENGKKLLDTLAQKTPHIVLLDHDMPVMNGLDTLKEIKVHYPEIKTIIVSMYNDDDLVCTYFESGASGYVNKNSSASFLLETINAVSKNGISISKENSEALINKKKPLPNEKSNFTDRELEIIRIIHSGKTNKEIASLLNVSLKTVDFHKANIYKKMGAYTSAGVAVTAIKLGIV